MLGILLQLFAPAKERPIELGKVNWLRDYDTALAKAKKEDKPVFILFQEVPGCATCRNFGKNVLSHPLIVEALETEFVPLAIYNNEGGKDLAVLKKYSEPTWNNPVARIVSADGENLIPRVSGKYSKLAVVQGMIDALFKHNRIAPKYLQVLHDELLAADNTEEAYLSMYCFWTGEKEISKIAGVVATDAGFMDGKEVVKVQYNTQKTDLEEIAKQAQKVNCADGVYADNPISGQRKIKTFRKDKESKYYLRHTDYQYLPMTAKQAMLVNQSLGNRQSPNEWLSPRQLKLLEKIAVDKSLKTIRFDQDITSAWVDLQ